MYYARIKSGIVVAICFFTDTTLVDWFSQGYDALVSLDSNPDNVDCGWSYDGNTFTPPN